MHHANEIRYCAYIASNICEVANEDKRNELPIMTGGLCVHLNDHLQFAMHGFENLNRTIAREHEYGIRNPDGSFSGCAGRVQRNESDFVLGLVQYPLDDYYRVYPYKISAQGKIAMISEYEIVHGFDVTDILDDAKNLFTPQLYLAILMVILSLVLLFKIFTKIRDHQRNRRRRRCRRILFQFFSVFIGQDSDFIDDCNWSRRMIFVSLSIFSFFILSVWCNLISTQSVVAKKAKVINNYKDFLERKNAKPYFMSMMSDHRYFQNAPKGSLPRQIWDRIDPKEVDKHVIKGHSTQAMMNVASNIRYHGGVFFVNEYAADFIINTVLRGLLQDDDYRLTTRYRIWKSTDPDSEIRTMGGIMRTDFRETIEGHQILKRSRLGTEVGMNVYVKKNLDKGMMTFPKDPPGMAEFASPTVVTEQVENDCQTKMANLYRFFAMYGWMSLLGLFGLITEIIWHRIIRDCLAKIRRLTLTYILKMLDTDNTSTDND